MRPLIIACGNPDRGDDAAGLLVARRLRELGIDVVEHLADALSLLELWRGYGSVVLIDAVVTGAAPGSVRVWDGGEAQFVAGAFAGTHAFEIAEAVNLARALGRLPSQLWIYGIEASRFHIGTGPSAEVMASIEPVVQAVARRFGPSAAASLE